MFRLIVLSCLICLGAGAETLVLLSKCDTPTCLVMDLTTGGPKTSEKKRTLKNGTEEMTFSVRGKPGKSHERAFHLLFHRTARADDCRGLGPVAVIGMNEDRPILATNAGPIEITDGSLVAGCVDCLRVVDPATGKTLSEPPSPSRDLNHLGFGPKDFSVDKSGVVWLHADATRCLKLSRDGNFTTGDSDICSPREPKPVSSPAASPAPGFQRFEAGKHQLWIAEPSC